MRLLALLLGAFCSSGAVAGCYQVMRGDEVVSQTMRPPVDMSYDPVSGPSADLIAMRARGEHLVILKDLCAFEIGAAEREGVAPLNSAQGMFASSWISGSPSAEAIKGAQIARDGRGGRDVLERDIHIGPRGGRYYKTESGATRYVSQDQ